MWGPKKQEKYSFKDVRLNLTQKIWPEMLVKISLIPVFVLFVVI